METHLNTKNVLKNFCDENEQDCLLIKELQISNKLTKEQKIIQLDKN